MPFVDYYEVLGLVRGVAKVGDLRPAYKKAAIKYHPDRNRDNPKATELFQTLREAVETLDDVGKRMTYHQYHDRYRDIKKKLQSLLDKREELRKQSSVLQAYRARVNNYDFPRCTDEGEDTGFADYIDYGGDDEEIKIVLLLHLAGRMDELDQQLKYLAGSIAVWEQEIEDIPMK